MVQCTQLYFIQSNGQVLIAVGNCSKIVKMTFNDLYLSHLANETYQNLAQNFLQWRDLILLISIN